MEDPFLDDPIFRLNTDKFEKIVNLYDLSKPLDFFLLYNKSEFMNAYHGWEHVKRMICTLQTFIENDSSVPFQFSNVYHLPLRELFIAAIFHDFNYSGTDKSDPEYDSENIALALRGYVLYLEQIENRKVGGFGLDYIRATQFPRAFNEEFLSTCSVAEKMLIDADISMVLHEGFPAHSLLYYVLDSYGEISEEKYIENVKSWNKSCRFSSGELRKIWRDQKESILEETISFFYESLKLVDSVKESYPGETRFSKLADLLRQNRGFHKEFLLSNHFDYIENSQVIKKRCD